MSSGVLIEFVKNYTVQNSKVGTAEETSYKEGDRKTVSLSAATHFERRSAAFIVEAGKGRESDKVETQADSEELAKAEAERAEKEQAEKDALANSILKRGDVVKTVEVSQEGKQVEEPKAEEAKAAGSEAPPVSAQVKSARGKKGK